MYILNHYVIINMCDWVLNGTIGVSETRDDLIDYHSKNLSSVLVVVDPFHGLDHILKSIRNIPDGHFYAIEEINLIKKINEQIV